MDSSLSIHVCGTDFGLEMVFFLSDFEVFLAVLQANSDVLVILRVFSI